MEILGERALVTGAGGFAGSHLVEALVAAGVRVRAFVHYHALGSWGWLDALPAGTLERVEVVAGDVRDAGAVEAAARECALVFHLAALVSIPHSYAAPSSYVDTNVRGTLHVLEAARRAGAKRVLVASTSEVYGTARTTPMDEGHPLCAQSPYAASKIAADKLAESFARSFGLPVVIVRPFNIFGPRQSARAVIPALAIQLLEPGGDGEVRAGNQEARRDFTYVADAARAFVALARCDAAVGEEVHVASGADISVREVAERLAARIAPGARIVTDPVRLRPERSEVERLLGSSAKLRALTGWAPAWSFDDGLAATVAWLREPANLGRYRARHHAV